MTKTYEIPRDERVSYAVQDALRQLSEFSQQRISKTVFKELLRPILERWGVSLSEVVHTLADYGYIRLRQRSIAVTAIADELNYRSALQAIALAAQNSPFTLESVKYWARGRTTPEMLDKALKDLVAAKWLKEEMPGVYIVLVPFVPPRMRFKPRSEGGDAISDPLNYAFEEGVVGGASRPLSQAGEATAKTRRGEAYGYF